MGRPCFALSVLMVLLASSLLAVGTANGQIVIAVLANDELEDVPQQPSRTAGSESAHSADWGAEADYRAYLEQPAASSSEAERASEDDGWEADATPPSAAFDETEGWEYDVFAAEPDARAAASPAADVCDSSESEDAIAAAAPGTDSSDPLTCYDPIYDSEVYGTPAAEESSARESAYAEELADRLMSRCWGPGAPRCEWPATTCPLADNCYELPPLAARIEAEVAPTPWWYTAVDQVNRGLALLDVPGWVEQFGAATADSLAQLPDPGQLFRPAATVTVAREAAPEVPPVEDFWDFGGFEGTTFTSTTVPLTRSPLAALGSQAILRHAAEALDEASDSLRQWSDYLREMAE